MALYRALRNLSGVCRKGALTRLTHLTPDQIAKLETVGAVARVSAPPLAELPAWKARASRLEKMGIADAEQLADADVKQVATALRVKPETAAAYQQDILQFLLVQED